MFKEFDNKLQEFEKTIKDLVYYKFKVFEKTSKDELDIGKAALEKLKEGFGKFDGNTKEIKDKVHIVYTETKKKNYLLFKRDNQENGLVRKNQHGGKY